MFLFLLNNYCFHRWAKAGSTLNAVLSKSHLFATFFFEKTRNITIYASKFKYEVFNLRLLLLLLPSRSEDDLNTQRSIFKLKAPRSTSICVRDKNRVQILLFVQFLPGGRVKVLIAFFNNYCFHRGAEADSTLNAVLLKLHLHKTLLLRKQEISRNSL